MALLFHMKGQNHDTDVRSMTSGRKPILGTAMTSAERQRRHRNKVRKQDPYEGWKEATLAWLVCASIHREYAKGKDPFFKTRQQDFIRHEKAAREKYLALVKGKTEVES